MSKKQRLLKIMDIISTNTVETQGQLTRLLIDYGYDVTQATVSRDIKELRLIKVADYAGRYKYSVPGKDSPADTRARYITLLKHSVITIQAAMNIVVVKAIPGSAQGCAMAIETLEFENIVGTIAGDDTVFIALTTPGQAEELVRKIDEVVS